MKKIDDAILIDFHGVLTDGSQSITHDGQQMFEHVHTRDVRAIREFVWMGYYVVIATASSNPLIKEFADRVGAALIVERDKAKLASRFQNYTAIGDDAWDVAMLRGAKRAYCPSDADISVKRLENVHVLDAKGGKGCIAEVLSLTDIKKSIDNESVLCSNEANEQEPSISTVVRR